MDNKKLLRLARLRSVAAKANLPFDLMRFTEDRGYAVECLRKLMDSSNDELLLLCLEVQRDMFPQPSLVAVPPPPKVIERGAADQRYVGKLR